MGSVERKKAAGWIFIGVARSSPGLLMRCAQGSRGIAARPPKSCGARTRREEFGISAAQGISEVEGCARYADPVFQCLHQRIRSSVRQIERRRRVTCVDQHAIEHVAIV